MKRYILLKTLVCFLFFTTMISAQTFSDERTVEEEVLEGNNLSQAVLNNFGFETPTPINKQLTSNAIYVQQIGSFNTFNANTRTNASDINIRQEGDSNGVSLDYTANIAIADLTQLGNENRIKDFVQNPAANVSLELTQEGNNLNFERFGTNSITESLKFKQTSASPSIIVRSFQ